MTEASTVGGTRTLKRAAAEAVVDRMFDSLRNPEHTRENRCWPCTVVNAALLALGCVSVALWLPAKRGVRALSAVALAVGGGVAIAFRGYVVPATPRFAPRLVREIPVVRAVFGHGGDADLDEGGPGPGAPGSDADWSTTGQKPPGSDAAGTRALARETDDAVGERAADALLDAGVLHAVGDALHLDGQFRERWRDAMADVREGDAGDGDGDLGTAVQDAAPHVGTVAVVDDGRWVVLASGDPAAERWVPRPVAVAEVSAVRTLADEGVPGELRVPAASALRTFLRACPACDTALVETTTGDCCGSGPNPMAPPEPVLACPECEQRSVTLD